MTLVLLCDCRSGGAEECGHMADEYSNLIKDCVYLEEEHGFVLDRGALEMVEESIFLTQ